MFGRIAPQTPYRIRFVDRNHVDRSRLEDHIHATYARAYGADITDFMPTLIALESGDGDLHAVLGLRAAGSEPLFLEAYLDRPIERTIAMHHGGHVERARVVELGNLAAGSPGSARLLVMALNAYLQGAGFEWVCFTAVPALRNVFRRLDLGLLELAPADPQRLGVGARQWGRYYDTHPTVVAGDVRYGFRRLEALMTGEYIQSMIWGLWRQALLLGCRRTGQVA